MIHGIPYVPCTRNCNPLNNKASCTTCYPHLMQTNSKKEAI